MINALKELEKDGVDLSSIKALRVQYRDNNPIIYKKGDKLGILKKTLAKINYDNGFGLQELYGLILMNDYSWYERRSRYGREWWIHEEPPTIESIING